MIKNLWVYEIFYFYKYQNSYIFSSKKKKKKNLYYIYVGSNVLFAPKILELMRFSRQKVIELDSIFSKFCRSSSKQLIPSWKTYQG